MLGGLSVCVVVAPLSCTVLIVAGCVGPCFCGPCWPPFVQTPLGVWPSGPLPPLLLRSPSRLQNLLRLSLAVCVLVCGLCRVFVLYIKLLLVPTLVATIDVLGATLVVAEASQSQMVWCSCPHPWFVQLAKLVGAQVVNVHRARLIQQT